VIQFILSFTLGHKSSSITPPPQEQHDGDELNEK